MQDIFFTNDAIINDFKSYISFVLNHVNPRTGLGKAKSIKNLNNNAYVLQL